MDYFLSLQRTPLFIHKACLFCIHLCILYYMLCVSSINIGEIMGKETTKIQIEPTKALPKLVQCLLKDSNLWLKPLYTKAFSYCA